MLVPAHWHIGVREGQVVLACSMACRESVDIADRRGPPDTSANNLTPPEPRVCLCIGGCKGPEGLDPGWRCAIREHDVDCSRFLGEACDCVAGGGRSYPVSMSAPAKVAENVPPVDVAAGLKDGTLRNLNPDNGHGAAEVSVEELVAMALAAEYDGGPILLRAAEWPKKSQEERNGFLTDARAFIAAARAVRRG